VQNNNIIVPAHASCETSGQSNRNVLPFDFLNFIEGYSLDNHHDKEINKEI